MTQNILVFAGVKQSHKSTSCKYITASRMKQAGFLSYFDIDDNGDLIVSSTIRNPDGTYSEGRGVLDLKRTDDEFAQYAYTRIWPLAKTYSFADALKQSAIKIFSLDPKNIYGTDKDKETPTDIKWGDIFHLLSKDRQEQITTKHGKEYSKKFLTHREVLQDFGTICRVFKPNCWIESCWNEIVVENWPYVLIDDCRYENEVDFMKSRGAKVVLLTHHPFKDDNHTSEQIHKVDRKKFDYILDNAKMSFEEKNAELDKVLMKFGWTTGELT